MKFLAKAVVYDGRWLYGELIGFKFIKEKEILKQLEVPNIEKFKPISLVLKELKYNEKELESMVLKSIQVHEINNDKVSIKTDERVTKLFIYIEEQYEREVKEFANKNILCANCVYTCKQNRNVMIYSCKVY